MDIYTEKDSDIIYEVSFDTEYTRINYPPFICQYSKGLLIRINLLTNRKPLFDSAPDYEGTELIWFNYDKTTETAIVAVPGSPAIPSELIVITTKSIA